MKLGLLVEAEEGLSWAGWRQVLNAAQRLGFDSVWLSDHLESAWTPGRHGLDTWIALTYAAVHTRRLMLGSLVSPVTLRPPLVLARTVEAVAGLAGRRLTVGLGLGWNAQEHAAAGVPFPPLAERARLLETSIQCVRETVGAPILVGGAGRATLAVAARAADAWNMTTASVEVYRQRAAELDGLCAQHGRDPRQIRRSVACGFLIGRDAAELRERGRRMQALVPPLAAVADEQVAEAARQRGWIVGTPGELVAALEPFARAGVELAILGHYDLDDVDALELIAARVMPALG